MDETNILDKLLGNKYIIAAVLCILAVNIIVLNILFFTPKKNTSGSSSPPAQQSQEQCPQSCITQFSRIIPSPSASVSKPPVLTPTPTSTLLPTATPSSAPTPTSALREYFVPLGQGWGSYADWTVVSGMGAKINLANYGKIEKVYFEATIRIPTGNQTVYVRLYNANNYQSVSGSDLTLSGGTSTILTSQPITLTDGDNLYQIQLKTQLQYQTYIDQARIRIVSR